MGEERESWQVFLFHDDSNESEAIDGRDCCSLVYAGRIVKPEDGRSYWTPDEEIVGNRFGAGRYALFGDKTILDWTTTGYTITDALILLDIVAETKFKAREAATI